MALLLPSDFRGAPAGFSAGGVGIGAAAGGSLGLSIAAGLSAGLSGAGGGVLAMGGAGGATGGGDVSGLLIADVFGAG
ncbi:MAG TPA: hypothetical protein VJZ73_12335 [Methylomirabilota bacterium]|nr:hypothetical protein [Methylomirabilota bacterium]